MYSIGNHKEKKACWLRFPVLLHRHVVVVQLVNVAHTIADSANQFCHVIVDIVFPICFLRSVRVPSTSLRTRMKVWGTQTCALCIFFFFAPTLQGYF